MSINGISMHNYLVLWGLKCKTTDRLQRWPSGHIIYGAGRLVGLSYVCALVGRISSAPLRPEGLKNLADRVPSKGGGGANTCGARYRQRAWGRCAAGDGFMRWAQSTRQQGNTWVRAQVRHVAFELGAACNRRGAWRGDGSDRDVD